MFEKSTPESAGIPSKNILKFLKIADKHELALHSVVIARGNKLICEAYWKPFERNTPHRMYSQTKSFVGLAVLLLAEEGKISLDDKITDYFPDKLPEQIHPYLNMLTIKNMLMMRTCFDEYDVSWFSSDTDDRVNFYFSQRPAVMPGTQYRYDSNGSFVLCALVERITGETFLDYLRKKCLDEIGFSKNAYCLKCPGGYSWGDSALLCTPFDMLRFGNFIGNYGSFEGKQIIPRRIIEAVMNDFSDTYTDGHRFYDSYGYSNKFWLINGRSIGCIGMHGQYTLYDFETDITFTCTSGNFRSGNPGEIIMSYLFSEIIETAGNKLEDDDEAYNQLQDYIDSLSLLYVKGKNNPAAEKEIGGKIYTAEKNTGGIEKFSFDFTEDMCLFRFKNQQGEKELKLGRNNNIFQQFPQSGYSDNVGGKGSENNTYKCAASFGWGSENQMIIKVQIIDKYIGNLLIRFSFRDNFGRLVLEGDGENFLKEYNGKINAKFNF